VLGVPLLMRCMSGLHWGLGWSDSLWRHGEPPNRQRRNKKEKKKRTEKKKLEGRKGEAVAALERDQGVERDTESKDSGRINEEWHRGDRPGVHRRLSCPQCAKR